MTQLVTHIAINGRSLLYIALVLAFFVFFMITLAGRENATVSSGSHSTHTVRRPNLYADPVKRSSPPTKPEIGRSTWILLHSIATNFDDEPNAQQQEHAKQLVHSLLALFPCSVCSDDFKTRILTEFPLDVSSRKAFSRWTCVVHNAVNEKLKKPLVGCDHMDQYYLGVGE
jgi:hypothetical protein